MFHCEEFRNNFDAQMDVVHDNPYVDLIFDDAGPELGSAIGPSDVPTEVLEEATNNAASRFYDLLRDTDEPL